MRTSASTHPCICGLLCCLSAAMRSFSCTMCPVLFALSFGLVQYLRDACFKACVMPCRHACQMQNHSGSPLGLLNTGRRCPVSPYTNVSNTSNRVTECTALRCLPWLGSRGQQRIVCTAVVRRATSLLKTCAQSGLHIGATVAVSALGILCMSTRAGLTAHKQRNGACEFQRCAGQKATSNSPRPHR